MSSLATETYSEKQTAVQTLLQQIEAQVGDHARQQAACPDDWGFSGDLGHVEERLREVRGFLLPAGEDDDHRWGRLMRERPWWCCRPAV